MHNMVLGIDDLDGFLFLLLPLGIAIALALFVVFRRGYAKLFGGIGIIAVYILSGWAGVTVEWMPGLVMLIFAPWFAVVVMAVMAWRSSRPRRTFPTVER